MGVGPLFEAECAQCGGLKRLASSVHDDFGEGNGETMHTDETALMAFDHWAIIGPGVAAKVALEIVIAFGGVVVHRENNTATTLRLALVSWHVLQTARAASFTDRQAKSL